MQFDTAERYGQKKKIEEISARLVTANAEMSAVDLKALRTEADSAKRILEDSEEFSRVTDIATRRVTAINAMLEKITSDAPVIQKIQAAIKAVQLAQEVGDSVIEEWQKKIERLRTLVGTIPGVRTEVLFPWRLNFPQPIPRLMVYIERKDGEEKAELVRNALANGDAPIWTRPLGDVSKAKNVIVIDARTVQSKDVKVVAESLRSELRRALARPVVAVP